MTLPAGRFVEIDFGLHVFRFECDEEKPIERHIVITEGDKKAVVDLTLDGRTAGSIATTRRAAARAARGA
jgi:hypothetical protein